MEKKMTVEEFEEFSSTQRVLKNLGRQMVGMKDLEMTFRLVREKYEKLHADIHVKYELDPNKKYDFKPDGTIEEIAQ